jgi:hypothetical protein
VHNGIVSKIAKFSPAEWGKSCPLERWVKARGEGGGEACVDVASNCKYAVELGDLAELEGHSADDTVVQGIAGIDPKLADRVDLHPAQSKSHILGAIVPPVMQASQMNATYRRHNARSDL